MFQFSRVLAFAILTFPFAVVAQTLPFTISNSRTSDSTAGLALSDRTLDSLNQNNVQLIRAPGRGTDSAHSAVVLASNSPALLVQTGPENDMLSYRIGSLRNPTLVMKVGAPAKILFVNTDEDMHHDMRFSRIGPAYQVVIRDSNPVGTSRLSPAKEDASQTVPRYSTEEFDLVPHVTGTYYYYCSVSGHAAGGMWGKIVVVSADATTSEIDSLLSGLKPEPNEELKSTSGMNMSAMEGMSGMEGMGGVSGNDGRAAMPGRDNMPMGAMYGLLRTNPMEQESSGTSWVPRSTPMYMWMTEFHNWMLMVHGDLMPRYDRQGGPRGASKFDAPNMEMLMLGHDVGTQGRFNLLTMVSLDPLTEGGKGYPLLFQTGETWQGKKLVDDQHPHDLIAELAVTYSQELSSDISAYLYAGYPGEPALGPPVFMHRSSAMSNPDAPISHHWMDATHIEFGVATAGLSVGLFKLEASYFNGSEPDEDRYSFDKLKLNSYSGRISYNPSDDLALQISRGLLTNPEGDNVDVLRSTASAIYTRNWGGGHWWSSTLSWGENRDRDAENQGPDSKSEAVLFESEFRILQWAPYVRAEYVEKTNQELVLSGDPGSIHPIKYVTLGVTRTIAQIDPIDIELGAQLSYYFVPANLQSLYSEHPVSYEVFLSFHPKLW